MSGWFPGRASRSSASRSPASIRMPRRSSACRAARCRSTSPGSTISLPATWQPDGCASRAISRRRWPEPTRCSLPWARRRGAVTAVPVGTGRRVERILQKALPAGRFDVASNPEFLREGSAISDFMRPDRVVIGTESEHARTVLRALYRPLYLFETPIVFTTLETAELIKYAANAFLATKITFINEVADLCEAVGADVQDVARGIGLDGRIGGKFLHAGPGFGGSCFPKDCQALVRTAEEMKAPLAIVDTVLRVNDARKRSMARRVVEACGGSVEGLTLAALGLTFKPNTDDMRDSPSLAFLPALSHAGATVRAFDPEGIAEA